MTHPNRQTKQLSSRRAILCIRQQNLLFCLYFSNLISDCPFLQHFFGFYYAFSLHVLSYGKAVGINVEGFSFSNLSKEYTKSPSSSRLGKGQNQLKLLVHAVMTVCAKYFSYVRHTHKKRKRKEAAAENSNKSPRALIVGAAGLSSSKGDKSNLKR